jgi:pimeloyl-ACP methyl ester carboxylesterase
VDAANLCVAGRWQNLVISVFLRTRDGGSSLSGLPVTHDKRTNRCNNVNGTSLRTVLLLACLTSVASPCRALSAPATASSSPLAPYQATLNAAHERLVQNFTDIEMRMGGEQAALLEQRLDSDIGELASPAPAPDFSIADWTVRLEGIAQLDASLVDQAASGTFLPLAGSKGLVERFFRSRVDHTMQPFALYVPERLPANPALVVLLHGNPQTESELLAMPYFRSLADDTGTIVAAPWARGIPGYFPPADADVYQVADQVASAFKVPAGKTYLAGYSNGGYSVFKIGPELPARWAAIMCISGAIVNSETDSVRRAFANERVYVVNGARDNNVPAQDGARTAGWLAGVGIQTGFYQQPDGTHYLPALMPVLTRAWHDMLANRVDAAAVTAAQQQSGQAPAGAGGDRR